MNSASITLNHYAAPLEKEIRSAICSNNTILRIALYNLIAEARSLHSQDKAFRHTPIPNQITTKTHRNDKETHNRLCKQAKTLQKNQARRKTSHFLRTKVTLYDLDSIKELENKTETENVDLFKALTEINQSVNSSNPTFVVESTEVLINIHTHSKEKLKYWSTASRKVARLDPDDESVWMLKTPTRCIWEQITVAGLIFNTMIKNPDKRPLLIDELEIRLKQIEPFYQENEKTLNLFITALRNVLKMPPFDSKIGSL